MTEPTITILRFNSLVEEDGSVCANLLARGNTTQQDKIITNDDKSDTRTARSQQSTVVLEEDKIRTSQDQTDSSIGVYHKPMEIPAYYGPRVAQEENVCVFCLEDQNLIHICSCNVMTHKECALEYIRFPGSMNQYCCQCRTKLDYAILDKKTPMRKRYRIAFILLVTVYLAAYAVSIYGTYILIPQNNMNVYVYASIIANVGILWPLIVLYLISFFIDYWFGPRPKPTHTQSSGKVRDLNCWATGCYCSGGCDFGECTDCGGGDECGMLICLICILGVVILLLVAASGHLMISMARHYQSFKLKSTTEIMFKHEKRILNTHAYVES